VSPSADDVRVATYNVHGCVGRDGIRRPRWIARVIRGLAADVVGLQEVDSREYDEGGRTQLDALAASTGLGAWAGPALRDHRGEFGNALLTRGDVVEQARCDLSIPGCQPRGALELVVTVRGVTLAVAVTHLGLTRSERLGQVRRLLQWFGTRPALPRVLLADVNEWEPFGRIARVLQRSFHLAPPLRTFPARAPVLALDRILVQHPGRIAEVRTGRGTLARVASDHLPLVAAIRLAT
jgi:endonuclease/exonuclease/phosphatase family metal-dependent hydrolase